MGATDEFIAMSGSKVSLPVRNFTPLLRCPVAG